MLTDLQIAEFEARAAAGEKPREEWCLSVVQGGEDTRKWYMRKFPCEPTVEECYGPYRVEVRGFGVCVPFGPTGTLAAQLAAEHLLAEATRPLFADALDCAVGQALTHAAKCDELEAELDRLRARVAELEIEASRPEPLVEVVCDDSVSGEDAALVQEYVSLQYQELGGAGLKPAKPALRPMSEAPRDGQTWILARFATTPAMFRHLPVPPPSVVVTFSPESSKWVPADTNESGTWFTDEDFDSWEAL